MPGFGAGEGNRTLLMSLGRGSDDPPPTVRYGAESTVLRSSLSILLTVLVTLMVRQ